MKPMLRLIAIGTLGCTALILVPRAIPSDTAKPTATAVAPAKQKPFRYSVTVRVREYTGNASYEVTSFSLPVVATDTPATIRLTSGDVVITAKATVTRPQQTEMAVVNVSLTRSGAVVAAPTIAIAIGRKGSVHIGNDQQGLRMEMTLTGA